MATCAFKIIIPRQVGNLITVTATGKKTGEIIRVNNSRRSRCVQLLLKVGSLPVKVGSLSSKGYRCAGVILCWASHAEPVSAPVKEFSILTLVVWAHNVHTD